MTDPNAPTLDPVEDRIRRTFAARAEDMAPGDSTDDLLDLVRDGGTAPRRFGGARRPVLAAAAAVVVLAIATAGVALAGRDGDRDTGSLATAAEQASLGEADLAAVTAPRALVDALRYERDFAANTLLGIEDAIALPVRDTAQARADTDIAIASFDAEVASASDAQPERGQDAGGDADVEASYRPGSEGLGALAELRQDIDAYAGPRDLNNIGTADRVFDRYAAIVSELLEGQQRYAGEIEDTSVRTGAVAYARGMRLGEQTSQLVRIALLASIQPGPESVAELARLRTEVQYDLDALVTETAGTPFEDAAVAVVADVEEGGLLGLADAAMDGTGDIAEILDASTLLDEETWPTFLDAVEATLAAEV